VSMNIPLFAFLFLVSVEAQTQILSWDQNTETDLGYYSVYFGRESHNLAYKIRMTNTTQMDIGNFTAEPIYYFAVTATDFSENESAFSEEVMYENINYEPPQQPDSVILWRHDLPIKIRMVYGITDTIGFWERNKIEVNWWQKSVLKDRGWRSLNRRDNSDSTDYAVIGDSLLVLNTERLRTFNTIQTGNTTYDYIWKIRLRVVSKTDAMKSSAWLETGEWVQLALDTIEPLLMPFIKLEIIE